MGAWVSDDALKVASSKPVNRPRQIAQLDRARPIEVHDVQGVHARDGEQHQRRHEREIDVIDGFMAILEGQRVAVCARRKARARLCTRNVPRLNIVTGEGAGGDRREGRREVPGSGEA